MVTEKQKELLLDTAKDILVNSGIYVTGSEDYIIKLMTCLIPYAEQEDYVSRLFAAQQGADNGL